MASASPVASTSEVAIKEPSGPVASNRGPRPSPIVAIPFEAETIPNISSARGTRERPMELPEDEGSRSANLRRTVPLKRPFGSTASPRPPVAQTASDHQQQHQEEVAHQHLQPAQPPRGQLGSAVPREPPSAGRTKPRKGGIPSASGYPDLQEMPAYPPSRSQPPHQSPQQPQSSISTTAQHSRRMSQHGRSDEWNVRPDEWPPRQQQEQQQTARYHPQQQQPIQHPQAILHQPNPAVSQDLDRRPSHRTHNPSGSGQGMPSPNPATSGPYRPPLAYSQQYQTHNPPPIQNEAAYSYPAPSGNIVYREDYENLRRRVKTLERSTQSYDTRISELEIALGRYAPAPQLAAAPPSPTAQNLPPVIGNQSSASVVPLPSPDQDFDPDAWYNIPGIDWGAFEPVVKWVVEEISFELHGLLPGNFKRETLADCDAALIKTTVAAAKMPPLDLKSDQDALLMLAILAMGCYGLRKTVEDPGSLLGLPQAVLDELKLFQGLLLDKCKKLLARYMLGSSISTAMRQAIGVLTLGGPELMDEDSVALLNALGVRLTQRKQMYPIGCILSSTADGQLQSRIWWSLMLREWNSLPWSAYSAASVHEGAYACLPIDEYHDPVEGPWDPKVHSRQYPPVRLLCQRIRVHTIAKRFWRLSTDYHKPDSAVKASVKCLEDFDRLQAEFSDLNSPGQSAQDAKKFTRLCCYMMNEIAHQRIKISISAVALWFDSDSPRPDLSAERNRVCDEADRFAKLVVKHDCSGDAKPWLLTYPAMAAALTLALDRIINARDDYLESLEECLMVCRRRGAIDEISARCLSILNILGSVMEGQGPPGFYEEVEHKSAHKRPKLSLDTAEAPQVNGRQLLHLLGSDPGQPDIARNTNIWCYALGLPDHFLNASDLNAQRLSFIFKNPARPPSRQPSPRPSTSRASNEGLPPNRRDEEATES